MVEKTLQAIASLNKKGQHEASHRLAVELAENLKSDVRAQLAAAYACDRLGHETDAISYYEIAATLGIPPEEQCKFDLCYGSALREVGRFDESISHLKQATADHPDKPEFQAFLALTLFAAGDFEQAFMTLLDAALAAEGPNGFGGYRRALTEYRDELDVKIRGPEERLK